jgi:chromosome segregation ATPase
MCTVHKERVIKLEEESTREIDSRAIERQAHLRSLREVQESLENAMHSNSLLNEKVRVLEQDNSELVSDLKQLKKQENILVGQVEGLEASLAAESKALQKSRIAVRKLESEVASVRAEQERDKMEYEEKLLKIKSTSGQRKQSLVESELRLNEVTRLWHADQTAKDELSHNLHTAESKYEDINIEIQKLRDAVRINLFIEWFNVMFSIQTEKKRAERGCSTN